MDLFYISLVSYLVGIILIFLASKNLFSYQLLFAAYIFPAAVVASEGVFFLMSIGIFSIGVGNLFCNVITFFRPQQSLLKFRNSEVISYFSPRKIFATNLILLFFVFTLLSSIYFYLAGISLFGDEVGYDRLVNRHSVSGSYFFQRLFRVYLPIICMIYLMYSWHHSYKPFFNRGIFFIMLIATSLLLIFTGMRGNLVIFIFFPFVVLFGLVSKGNPFFLILRVFLLTFFGGMIVTQLMYPELDIVQLLELILARITTGATDGISYMYSTDVPINGFYNGSTYFNDILSIFAKLSLVETNAQTYGSYLANEMLGAKYNGEQAAVYIMGELYANFSYFGVFFGCFIAGIFLQLLYVITLHSKKDILFTPILCYFQAAFIAILGGPTLSMTFDYLITITFFIFTFFILMIFLSYTGGYVIFNRNLIKLR